MLLVAPPEDDALPANGRAFALGGVDVSALREAVSDEIRVVRGSDDPYSPNGAPVWARKVGARVDELAGAGHITPDDGYGEWAWCAVWCRNGTGMSAA